MESEPVFYDLEGRPAGFLEILKESNVNTIRLRLWVDPVSNHCDLDEVSEFSKALKAQGFDIWLTVHYSDTWADPSQQQIPEAWKNLDYDRLKDRVYEYTEQVVREIAPRIIQIGNEINNGFLHPHGHINQPIQFVEILNTAVEAVRDNSDDALVMIHYAGINGSEWFYELIVEVDYDLIGLSYYPIWHGKDLSAMQKIMKELYADYGKKVMIAETAYPFTLDWNDWTNNIIGSNEQLILPDYPASESGQKNFVNAIRNIGTQPAYASGFCYWGAELIAWKGPEATNGSPWENQALFDFNNRALPVLESFAVD
jgi:arabinogalactan endo-1,4-beta-galactosidase